MYGVQFKKVSSACVPVCVLEESKKMLTSACESGLVLPHLETIEL